MGMHLDFLAESISQPREPAHVHAHRKVLPLDKAGRDVARVRVATLDGACGASESGWTIASSSRGIAASDTTIVLFNHGIIDADAECAFDRVRIPIQAISRQLHLTSQPCRHVVHEGEDRKSVV